MSWVVWSRAWGVFVGYRGATEGEWAAGEERLGPELGLACHAEQLELCP